MKIASWNIRGFNKSLKHNGVRSLIQQHSIDLIGILETKINEDKLINIMRNKFSSWCQINNFDTHGGGRILVLWDPNKVNISVDNISPQVIHCQAQCRVSGSEFKVSFVYGLHTIVSRRPLWENLWLYEHNLSQPWLLVGDFNNVRNCEEKFNGAEVTPYEIRDFDECCLSLGILDMPSVGCFFTWTNNTVWSKIDRVMINNEWLQAGQFCQANFLPPGCISDHSPCIITLIQQDRGMKRSFKFFNMWTSHHDFQEIVRGTWNQPVIGSLQFGLFKKLQKLKAPLRQLNQQHFAHISARATRANEELKTAQVQLQQQPSDLSLKAKVTELRKQALFLSEAERQFYSQQAKCQFTLNSDKCTKFFHALTKRNSRKNHIAAIYKSDGSLTTSYQQVADEFVKYFEELLGTDTNCQPLDSNVILSGQRISQEQADFLIKPISDSEIQEALADIGNDKSPGPDGYSSWFFKSAWGTVGNQFLGAVK